MHATLNNRAIVSLPRHEQVVVTAYANGLQIEHWHVFEGHLDRQSSEFVPFAESPELATIFSAGGWDIAMLTALVSPIKLSVYNIKAMAAAGAAAG